MQHASPNEPHTPSRALREPPLVPAMAKSLRSKSKVAHRAKKRSSVTDYSRTAEDRVQRLSQKLLAAGKRPKVEEEDADEPAMAVDAATAAPAPADAAPADDTTAAPASTHGPRPNQRNGRWQRNKQSRPSKAVFTRSKRSRKGHIKP